MSGSFDDLGGHHGTPSRGANWIGLLIAGIVFVFSGIMGSVMLSSMSDNTSDLFSTPDTGFDDAVRAMTAGTVILGIVLIIAAFYVKTHEEDRAAHERTASMEQREQERREFVAAVKSTIKVRCTYCGTLNEEDAEKCESCGGPL